MKSFSKEKQIIIYSNDYNILDLEYKKNFIQICKNSEYDLVIILTNTFSSKQKNVKKINEKFKDCAKIIFLSDLTNSILLKFFYYILESTPSFFIKKVVRKLIVFIKFFLSNDIIKNINNIIISKNTKAILATNNQSIFIDKVENDFYKMSSESDIPFIGTPIVGWPKNYHNKFYKFDYFITNTLQDKIELKKMGVKSIFLGCISFDADKVYENLKVKKNTILILGVNSNNNFFKNFDVKLYYYELIEFFLKKNFNVYFKPHPRSPLNVDKFLSNDLFDLFNAKIKINFKPDFAISIMSASILEVVSQKIKTIMYLPNKFIINSLKKDPDFVKNINFDTNIPYLAKYCYWAKNKSDLEFMLQNKDACFSKIIKNFDIDFKSKNSSLKLIRFIEKLFTKKMQNYNNLNIN